MCHHLMWWWTHIVYPMDNCFLYVSYLQMKIYDSPCMSINIKYKYSLVTWLREFQDHTILWPGKLGESEMTQKKASCTSDSFQSKDVKDYKVYLATEVLKTIKIWMRMWSKTLKRRVVLVLQSVMILSIFKGIHTCSSKMNLRQLLKHFRELITNCSPLKIIFNSEIS